MKIRFGSTGNGKSRALLLGFVAFLIGFCCWYFQLLLSWSHRSILSSRLSNETSAKVKDYCGLSYDDYRCSVLSRTPNISEYCLNDAQITGVRLLPFLLFVLELCLIHDLFSVSEVFIRFFLYALGVTSIFIFAVITILIYHDTCANLHVIMFLFLMSGILFLLAIRDMNVHDERRRHLAADNG
jgi:hypothetical protein